MAYEADPYQTPAQRLDQYKDLFNYTRGLPAKPPAFIGAPPGTQMFMPGPPQRSPHFFGKTPDDLAMVNALRGPQVASTESRFPSPFSDVGKYTPTPLTRPSEPNDALKFWRHPSPQKVIPIREGLFGVPPEHLQRMAGDVLYPAPSRFFGMTPGSEPSWEDHQRYDNTLKPGGYQFSDPNAIWRAQQKGILHILPRK